MRRSRLLIICVVAVAVAAAALWWWTRSRPAPRPLAADPPAPVRFHFTDVTVRSPDLRVGPADVRGAVGVGQTSWRVEMTCEEPDGCSGDFRIILNFDSGSGEGTAAIGRYVDAPTGGPMRFEGIHEPPSSVTGIRRVSLEVRSRGIPGQTPQIPW